MALEYRFFVNMPDHVYVYICDGVEMGCFGSINAVETPEGVRYEARGYPGDDPEWIAGGLRALKAITEAVALRGGGP
jgi:hypothetical protein